MALCALFPAGVREIPLLYLTLPELLAREKNEEEVATLLASKEFWYRRLEEYGGGKHDDPRAAYYHVYAIREWVHGNTFELGQLRLPLEEELLSFLRGGENAYSPYKIGEYVAGYHQVDIRIRYYAALHYGDKAQLCQILEVSEDQLSREGKIFPCLPFSEEVIRHALTFELHTPINVVRYLIRNTNAKAYDLFQYILKDYAHTFTVENIDEFDTTLEERLTRQESELKTGQDSLWPLVCACSIKSAQCMRNLLLNHVLSLVKVNPVLLKEQTIQKYILRAGHVSSN